MEKEANLLIHVLQRITYHYGQTVAFISLDVSSMGDFGTKKPKNLEIQAK